MTRWAARWAHTSRDDMSALRAPIDARTCKQTNRQALRVRTCARTRDALMRPYPFVRSFVKDVHRRARGHPTSQPPSRSLSCFQLRRKRRLTIMLDASEVVSELYVNKTESVWMQRTKVVGFHGGACAVYSLDSPVPGCGSPAGARGGRAFRSLRPYRVSTK